jgi:hypothetical protein
MNPNWLQYDDGRWEDTEGQSGLGVNLMGRQQNALRRAALLEHNTAQMMAPGQMGPLRGLMHGSGLGGSPEWDGYFGAMQGKENAVRAQGGRIGIDMAGSWGPQRSGISWRANSQAPELDNELALNGLRRGYR